jgi:hypothetical protein
MLRVAESNTRVYLILMRGSGLLFFFDGACVARASTTRLFENVSAQVFFFPIPLTRHSPLNTLSPASLIPHPSSPLCLTGFFKKMVLDFHESIYFLLLTFLKKRFCNLSNTKEKKKKK